MNYHIFDNVLNNINSEAIRKFTINVLSACDPILEKIPASSTGKHHPEECCKEGGLIVHIQRACYFGNLFIRSCNFDKLDIKGDIILSALLLHDIAKKEHYAKYTDYVNHPIIAANMLDTFKCSLTDPIFNAIKSCVARHMGPFSPPSHKVPLNKYNMLELMVYQSDYLASQKTIEIVPHSA